MTADALITSMKTREFVFKMPGPWDQSARHMGRVAAYAPAASHSAIISTKHCRNCPSCWHAHNLPLEVGAVYVCGAVPVWAPADETHDHANAKISRPAEHRPDMMRSV